MGCAFALPAMLGVVIAPSFWGSMVFFFLECVLATVALALARSAVGVAHTTIARVSCGGVRRVPSVGCCRYLIAESWFGPALALMQALVPANVVGVTSSVFACVAMLVRACVHVTVECTVPPPSPPHTCTPRGASLPHH